MSTIASSSETAPPEGIRERTLHTVTAVMARHSVTALRISLGLVIAGFGALKFIPGASPAEGLVMATVDRLTFGMMTGTSAVMVTAALETVIGLILLAGRGLKFGLVLMAGWLGGILAPLVVLPEQMLVNGFPTLAGQYVLKDIILAAAWLVVAAHALGARMVGPNQER